MLRRRSGILLLCGLSAHAAACSDSGDTARDDATQGLSPGATPGGQNAGSAGSAGLPGTGLPGTGLPGTGLPDTALPPATTDVFSPSDRSVHPSAGCGLGGERAAGQQTLVSGGQEGHYIISLPPSYDPNTPGAVGFVFHGANNTDVSCFAGGNCAGVQQSLSSKSILIYPRSFGTSWTAETRDQNVAWFDDLLAYVKANFCVDEHKVYVFGTSSGAHFSNILGCRRGDELRAIAPAAGERLEKTGCRGEFAALVIHGIDDMNSVPFRLGEEARDFYAQANGCSAETVPPLATLHAEVRALRDAAKRAVPPASTAGIFRCADYQGCREGLPVRWCEHGEDGYDGTTHGYPLEGGPTTWDFVSQL